MCRSVCLLVCLCTMYVQSLQRPEEGAETHGIGTTEGCELHVGLLKEEPVLLTSELSLQPSVSF